MKKRERKGGEERRGEERRGKGREGKGRKGSERKGTRGGRGYGTEESFGRIICIDVLLL